MGVALALVVEATSLADSGTTWTPSIIEGAECAPETSPVEEGTDVGEPEDTVETETEVFGAAEGMADAETEPELEIGTCVVGEAVAVAEVDGTVAVEALLLVSALVAVAGTEVKLAPASPGVSITTGSLATNTRATF